MRGSAARVQADGGAVERWSWPLQLLHWLSLLLIVTIATMGLLMVELPRGDATRSLLYATHKSLGISVLAIAAVRLLLRALGRAPAALPAPCWQQRLARASHVLMYLLLLLIPLSGWLLNSVAGQPLPWFGLFDLPALAGRNPQWRKPVDTAHVLLFWTLVTVVAIHVAAALHHHWVKRDATLRRMLPGAVRAHRRG